MIIINQNRTEVFNFNGIYRLFIDEWFEDESSKEPDCFYIKAEKNNDDTYCNILGKYTTEEKAKEVLMEMCFCYEDEIYRMPKERSDT